MNLPLDLFYKIIYALGIGAHGTGTFHHGADEVRRGFMRERGKWGSTGLARDPASRPPAGRPDIRHFSLGGFSAALICGISLQNPFSLGPAINFSFFFVAILFMSKIAKIYLGDKGLYLALLFSGLTDVDAITLSIVQQTKAAQLAQDVGAIDITIAVVANSVVKSAISVYTGGWRFGRRIGFILIGATAAGLFVSLIF